VLFSVSITVTVIFIFS